MYKSFFSLQTANVAYFQKKKSNNPDFLLIRLASPSKLFRINGVILYLRLRQEEVLLMVNIEINMRNFKRILTEYREVFHFV